MVTMVAVVTVLARVAIITIVARFQDRGVETPEGDQTMNNPVRSAG